MANKRQLKISSPQGLMLGTEPVPVDPCISAAYFDKEADTIFRRVWLNIGRETQVEKAGDYFVRDLPNIKASILVMRGKDGVLRAFHNVCMHRGNRLARDCAGQRSRISCGYHGWTYDTTGKLVGVPDEDQFYDLDRQALGLKRVAVDTWNGFIFINMQPKLSETLAESFGDLVDAFHDFPFSNMVRVATYAANVKANWKVCMDIGSEAYHVTFVHKSSVPDSHVSEETSLANRLSVQLHGRHRRTSLVANPQHKLSPSESIVARHAPTVIQGYQDVELPSCLNPEGEKNWGFDTNIFFPNFGMLLSAGWFVTHLYWPVSVNETRWETTLYTLPPKTAGERLSQEYSAVLTRDLIREDWAQVERVQQGLQTGALTHMMLSDQEIMVRHAYKVVEDFVNA